METRRIASVRLMWPMLAQRRLMQLQNMWAFLLNLTRGVCVWGGGLKSNCKRQQKQQGQSSTCNRSPATRDSQPDGTSLRCGTNKAVSLVQSGGGAKHHNFNPPRPQAGKVREKIGPSLSVGGAARFDSGLVQMISTSAPGRARSGGHRRVAHQE